MLIENFWQSFLDDFPEYNKNVQPKAWQFGVEPDSLANLVKDGTKTATASGYRLYAIEDEPLPQIGELNIILNSSDQPMCVTRTRELKLMRFDEVSEDFAYLEGEGDRSLAYWRHVHYDFFTNEYAQHGLDFNQEDFIVGEIFECLYY